MKHIIYILTIVSLVIVAMDCKKGKEKTDIRLEGWMGAPESPEKKPFDYYYMRTSGRASERAIVRRSGEMMQSTCSDAATVYARADLIGKMIGESITGASGLNDGEGTGLILVREYAGKIQGFNTASCKPLAVPDPDIAGSEYKECECVVYVKLTGGRDGIIQRGKEIEKN
jgi:hypothetical protein